MRVIVRIEAERTTDTYWRSHGKSIDQPLKNDWWLSQPEKNIGIAGHSFTHEQTVDVGLGRHYVEYAASGYVPDYAWHAKIYVNEKLLAEGDVGRENPLRACFLGVLGFVFRIPGWFLFRKRRALTV